MKKILAFSLMLFGILGIAGPARAAGVLDTMDSSALYTPGGDVPSQSLNGSLVPGVYDQAVQVSYDFTSSGTYAQTAKDFTNMDLSEMYWPWNKLRFYYRTAGPANKFIFAMTDSGSRVLYSITPAGMDNQNWTKVEYSSKDLSFSGSGTYDFYRVNKIETKSERDVGGGSGTLDVDKVEIVQSAMSAASLLADDFNDGALAPHVNRFGQVPGTFEGANVVRSTGILSISTDGSSGNVYEGAASMKMQYNFLNTTNTILGYYSSPNNADLSAYTQLEFYAKSSNENESFQVVLGSTTQVALSVGGVGSSWKKFTVSLRNFPGIFQNGAGLTAVGALTIQAVRNLSSNIGTLWFDGIQFSRPELEGDKVVKVIDEMEEPASQTGWGVFSDSGTTKISSIVNGYDGRALRLTYDFGIGNYVGMYRLMYPNVTIADGFRFMYKYSNGDKSPNNLQFNALDSDGVRFYSQIDHIPDTGGQWKPAYFPFSKFLAGVATSNSLNLTKMKEFRFTLLKDKGGKGSLAIDQFEALYLPKNVTNADMSRLIQNFSLDHNPFSPNGDGMNDQVTFTYQIGEDSYMRLRVYDQRGSVVREIKKASPDAAGVGQMTWDGISDSEGMVKNGLYFFQLTAESTASERKDKVTSVIGVLR